MSLIIAGDVVPYNKDIKLFKDGNLKKLLKGELYDIWNNSQHKVFNLEAPLINEGIPIIKCGPNLKIDEDCIFGIKKMNPSIVCLANNHIMDYGVEGLNKTINLLNENMINFVGIGKNIESLKKYEILSVDNKKVALLNVCENEFSVSSYSEAGTYGYDEGNVVNELLELKKKNDYAVVIYHGGKEHYRYPSPLLQKRCRLLSDFGADLVICQHSHCIGCMEKYNNTTIVYGQGNFLFNKYNNEFWNNSLIINVSFKDNIDIDYIPITKCDDGIKIPEKNNYDEILSDFYKRSNEIKKNNFIYDNYNKYSKEMLKNYLIGIHNSNFIFRLLLKITNKKILNIIYSEKKLAIIQNYLECEAHRELFINGIKVNRKDNL